MAKTKKKGSATSSSQSKRKKTSFSQTVMTLIGLLIILSMILAMFRF
jgi:hypothetical protein